MTRADALLSRATTRLCGENARLEAELLLAEVLGCTRTKLITHPETEVDPATTAGFLALVNRRTNGEPVAYLLGHCGFWTLELLVNPSVLIPRPESERLVEITLALLGQGGMDIAELGTGSGALALALASERPQWRIQAVERNPSALAVARQNATNLGLEVDWRAGDWCYPLSPPLDAIIANPPYIAEGDPHLAALAHEPRSALVADAGGLADLRSIIAQAPDYLRPGGWLLLETGADQGAAVRALFDRRWSSPRNWRDLSGHERVCGAQRLPATSGNTTMAARPSASVD